MKTYAATGTTPAPSVEQPLRWKARWLDGVTGLYDVRARQWAPGAGVFTEVDEYAFHSSSTTLWGWPNQAPSTFADPTGRFATVVIFTAAALAATVVAYAALRTTADAHAQAAPSPSMPQLYSPNGFTDAVGPAPAPFASPVSAPPTLEDIARQASKEQSEREGDATRGLSAEQIREKFRGKLSPGEIEKLIQKVEKIRAQRNKSKDSRKGGKTPKKKKVFYTPTPFDQDEDDEVCE